MQLACGLAVYCPRSKSVTWDGNVNYWSGCVFLSFWTRCH